MTETRFRPIILGNEARKRAMYWVKFVLGLVAFTIISATLASGVMTLTGLSWETSWFILWGVLMAGLVWLMLWDHNRMKKNR